MFEDKNSLPRAQLHFAVDDRNRLARPGQNHPDMGRHVVRSFRIMLEIIGIFWYQVVEEFLQITTCRRIGIFHHNETATGMLDKNSQNAIANA